jgi:TM2 domain-containing membrane protein YozV
MIFGLGFFLNILGWMGILLIVGVIGFMVYVVVNAFIDRDYDALFWGSCFGIIFGVVGLLAVLESINII